MKFGYFRGAFEVVRHCLAALKRLTLRAPSLASDTQFPPRRLQRTTEPLIPAGFDSLAALESYDGDVLVIESEKDEIIPRSHIEAYLRGYRALSTRKFLKQLTP